MHTTSNFNGSPNAEDPAGGPDSRPQGARPLGGETAPLFAGAAVGVGGVGAVLALMDVSSPLRAPFTLFFLLAAPAAAIAAALGRMERFSRIVVAVAGALALNLLVAQAMLALHSWSARGGVVAVGAISAVVFAAAQLRRRRAGDSGSGAE